MDLEQLNQYIAGFSDHIFDLQQIAIEVGYWCGYYNNSKHPKPVNNIIKSLKNKLSRKEKGPASDPDVETFMELERKRLQMYEKGEKHA